MRRRAAVLCAAAAVLAGSVTGVPAQAAAPAPLAWKKCATDDYPTLECASLKVPLDHADPAGRQITLALSRVPHTAAAAQGPLLVNPGGPGGSGIALAGFVASALPKDVAARYDVIGFDPRGVGRSSPALDCVPGHFTPVRPDTVPGTPALEQANLERARSFAAACGKRYGDVLPYMDTVSSAQDMDSIREALGAPRISYFGYSYGTYLGAVYARLHPDRVRRLVLDSIVDPTGVWYADNIGQERAFDDRHRALMAWIAKYDATYGLGKDPAKVEAEWYAMRAALAKKPAGGKVGAAELEDTFMPGGYYNGYWPYLAEAFASYVHDKKTGPLVEAYDDFAGVDASGDNGYSVYTAVQCGDTAWPRDWARWRQDAWAVYAKSPFMTWNNVWYNAPCLFWPSGRTGQPSVANAKLPPTLLFQATDDAATPYAGGVAAHRLLTGSSLVVEQGGGNHGITLSGNACLDGYLFAYLADGKVPRASGPADAVCAKSPDPTPLASKAASTASRGSILHGLLGFRS
ncbi:alpha/beta fold hydrolase [Streptomyces sp. SID8366]|uniref:alpha/beta hydrolase n=1 Tax=unclassified Streptomyces TaxID=2593676 RepID=UPI000DBA0FC6|nr:MULTISPECIES: alpha/beta hydrolase [unclassified Streptomyces]MYU05451.1 alpha/beta fold hydrolase [Streptomyces sp. SID8366]MYU67549.1 alpha/beta fold hydrolase [Streptomyces sp. SID69]RAJ66337.1 alpha/beta hydrolase family protein [Streptomyces sp. PsTaAH-130]